MKQNKFRAWDKISKNMVYLDFNQISHDADCKIKMSSHHFGYQVWLNFILPAYSSNNQYQEDPYIELENIEWMQFTGIKDSQNKNIYEKDILLNPQGKIFIVEWGSELEYCGFVLREPKRQIGDLFLNKNLINSKIIGNTYENHELI